MVFAVVPVVAPAPVGIPVRVIGVPAGLVTGRPTISGPVAVPPLGLARSLPPLLYDTIELLIASVPPAWLLMPAPAEGVGRACRSTGDRVFLDGRIDEGRGARVVDRAAEARRRPARPPRSCRKGVVGTIKSRAGGILDRAAVGIGVVARTGHTDHLVGGERSADDDQGRAFEVDDRPAGTVEAGIE